MPTKEIIKLDPIEMNLLNRYKVLIVINYYYYYLFILFQNIFNAFGWKWKPLTTDYEEQIELISLGSIYGKTLSSTDFKEYLLSIKVGILSSFWPYRCSYQFLSFSCLIGK